MMTSTATRGAETAGPSLGLVRSEDPAQLLAQAHATLTRAFSLLSPAPNSAPGGASSASDSATPIGIESLLASIEISEQILALAGATQMSASVAFRTGRIAQQRADGVPRKDLGKGVAEEIALVRRASPARTRNHLALERVVVESMPRTLDLLARGEICTWAADEVAKGVICLDDEDRARVDRDISAQLPEVSPTRAGVLARARADELDQAAALARHEREISERHVSIRPASGSTVRLSALLPLAEGVAVYKVLDRAASTARSQGIEGTRGQHMADALVARVTGQQEPGSMGVEIQLMMTDKTLLDEADDVAWIDGHPVPAGIARRFALHGDPEDDSTAQRFVRRLLTDPISGRLTAADDTRRRFSGPDRRFIEIADQRCRTPWCEASIRHIDHVESYADGGATRIDNGAGLCESCNYLMETQGWIEEIRTGAAGGHDGSGPPEGSVHPVGSGPLDAPAGPEPPPDRALRLTTPTGRTFTSVPPPLRWPRPDLDTASRHDDHSVEAHPEEDRLGGPSAPSG
ncbi:HNH endonuclease [Brachybacterium sp. ACRRE]|uniref:HNH endonuclease n=1 Tax=Brachybacterium sp. ACRRE TaxID=2918184 RepID=UPI001EF2C150|nr:HNH endonuclease [Brachybacterium sp. ACRRE]MCG7309058.1 HNH endonuclease [Brachybacterium sp. ACRRE]